MTDWIAAIGTVLRILTFRADRAEIEAFNRRHLTLALGVIWLADVVHGWHDAGLMKRLGLFSLVDVLFLSYFLWVVVRPFVSADASYRRMLTFICISQLPVILLPIPSAKTLQMNLDWAIPIASVFGLWHFSLYVWYLARVEDLRGLHLIVLALMLPAIEFVLFASTGSVAGIIVVVATGNIDRNAILNLTSMLSVVRFFLFKALIVQYLWNVGYVETAVRQRRVVLALLIPAACVGGFGVIAGVMASMGYINLHRTPFVFMTITESIVDAIVLLPLIIAYPIMVTKEYSLKMTNRRQTEDAIA